jgi:ABC-2 type transport system ATP-binding protein
MVDVHERFGDIKAVNGLSPTIHKGKIFGLLGPNGAGKTTLVNLAVGLLKPDAGTITLDGAGRPDGPAARKRIGVATQALALYMGLSAEENVRFSAA